MLTSLVRRVTQHRPTQVIDTLRNIHPFSTSSHLSAFSHYTQRKEWCAFNQLDQEHILVTIGLTDLALDEIGDPKRIEPLAQVGTQVPAGLPLLNIVWDGHIRTPTRTRGNGLIHDVWESKTGLIRPLEVPFGGRVLQYNEEAIRDPDNIMTQCEEQNNWLVHLQVHKGYLESIREQLLTREEFERMIEMQDEKFKYRPPTPCA